MPERQARTAAHLVVRRSRVRNTLIGVLALVLCVVAVRFAWTAETVIERLFAGSMALFLGMVAVFTLLLAVDRTPVLEFDEDGLIDRGSIVRAGRVGWDQIRAVEARDNGADRFLVVGVYRPQRFVVDLPPEQRRQAEELIQRYGTPIVIPWRGLDRSLTEVVERAGALRRQHSQSDECGR